MGMVKIVDKVKETKKIYNEYKAIILEIKNGIEKYNVYYKEYKISLDFFEYDLVLLTPKDINKTKATIKVSRGLFKLQVLFGSKPEITLLMAIPKVIEDRLIGIDFIIWDKQIYDVFLSAVTPYRNKYKISIKTKF